MQAAMIEAALATRDVTGVPGSSIAMRTKKLNAYFGQTHAIHDVTLDFQTNEVTAIIGPSGCGKSTLLRCLNRMHETLPHTRVDGKVHFHGQDIYADGVDPISLRRHV